jgi:hypothetical protein
MITRVVPDRQDFYEFICKQCGATTRNDIILVGALYGYCRIIAKLSPGEAAHLTVKIFKQSKQTEVNTNEQEKASNT